MIRLEQNCRCRARARCRLAAVVVAAVIGLCGCEGAGVGVSYSAGSYSAPYDYDYDYDYGPWGPGYYVGPPVVVGGVVVHDHDHGGHPAPHYRAPAPARSVPSIPSRSRRH